MKKWVTYAYCLAYVHFLFNFSSISLTNFIFRFFDFCKVLYFKDNTKIALTQATKHPFWAFRFQGFTPSGMSDVCRKTISRLAGMILNFTLGTKFATPKSFSNFFAKNYFELLPPSVGFSRCREKEMWCWYWNWG